MIFSNVVGLGRCDDNTHSNAHQAPGRGRAPCAYRAAKGALIRTVVPRSSPGVNGRRGARQGTNESRRGRKAAGNIRKYCDSSSPDWKKPGSTDLSDTVLLRPLPSRSSPSFCSPPGGPAGSSPPSSPTNSPRNQRFGSHLMHDLPPYGPAVAGRNRRGVVGDDDDDGSAAAAAAAAPEPEENLAGLEEGRMVEPSGRPSQPHLRGELRTCVRAHTRGGWFTERF